MILRLLMILYLLQCLSPPVGSIDNIARLEAISKIQQDLFVESSGKLERNYVGMSELIIGSTKYLVTTSLLTTNRTFLLFLFKDLESFLSNRFINPPLELKVNDSSAGNALKPFQGARFIRLFNVGQRLYVMYATTLQRFAELMMLEGSIYFNQRDRVVVNSSNIPNECHNFNNWAPVSINGIQKGYVNFMFVCSVYPHRVLPMMYKKDSTTQVQIIFDDHNLDYQTVIAHEQSAEYFMQLLWPYGYPEYGTTPFLIDTPQGQRFISFFWSASTIMSSSKMNFFGAYLFDKDAPLRITHFSIDPVLILPYLHKKLVPIGSMEINGSIVVMLGDGINSYWVLLKKKSFLKSLRAVFSTNLSEAHVHQHYHARISSSYYEIHFNLVQIQKKQYETFLVDDWQLIGTTRNPSVVYFNGSFLVLNCPPVDHIRWGLFQCSYQRYDNFLSRSDQNHFNRPSNVSSEKSSENTYLALSAEDMRLIVVNETRLYGVFTNHRPRKQKDDYVFDPYVSELVFKDSHLLATEPTLMNVSQVSSPVSQKNWSPFVCNVSVTGLCFVQYIVPHTIVKFREKSIGDTNMVVLATSSFEPSTIWVYGEPRGGSPAELVDTPYGRRFFALFHSCKERGEDKKGRGIKTYYAGGYLFRAVYPYDITHISVEPIAPVSFYNMSQQWAHRGMDFVVFPMSLLIRGDIAYVSFGVQDRAGYMVSFKLHAFFLTLKAVTSRPHSP